MSRPVGVKLDDFLQDHVQVFFDWRYAYDSSPNATDGTKSHVFVEDLSKVLGYFSEELSSIADGDAPAGWDEALCA